MKSGASLKREIYREDDLKTSVTDARAELLSKAPSDSWIALSQDETRIVAVGHTYEEAVRKSDDAGESDPVLLKTPKAWLPFSV
jgi:hypothetical protein